MTREEAKEIFLSRGLIKADRGDNVFFDGNKWREACSVISEWLKEQPILDKIKAEIIENSIEDYKYHGWVRDELIIETSEVLQIIDKYEAESEDKE